MTDDMTYLKAEEAAVRNEIDASISHVFQKLIDNKGRTAKAVSNKDSLTVYMTGATEKSSLLGRIGRVFFPKNVPYLTEEMVENNARFQEYSDILSQQGYEVNLHSVKDNDGVANPSNYMFGGGLSAIFTSCMSGNTKLMALGVGVGVMSTLMGSVMKLDAYPSMRMSFSPKASPA